ncbi:MAG TPA: calcium-binding protein [Nocardioidaceae bacterium]|nr:calcium-binding protein [Nocardioidaceae bacterium]
MPVLAASAAPCTIQGTPGPDRLVGTAANDVVCGGGGDDLLIGRGGADRLLGGGGDDHLIGGAGRDVLRGGDGDDKVEGGRHDDRLEGDAHDDLLLGGYGADVQSGGDGVDTVSYEGRKRGVVAGPGGTRNDGVPGEEDAIWWRDVEHLVGGDGSDLLTSFTNSRSVTGGRGDDVLRGLQWGDRLLGGVGADRLYGGLARDTLLGGAGPDVLFNNRDPQGFDRDRDRDRVDGGRGSDLCMQDLGDRVTNCTFDTTPPEIKSLSVDKSTVVPGDTVTVTVEAADQVGVTEALAEWVHDGSLAAFCRMPMRLSNGTTSGGNWSQVCTIPEDAENGEYVVTPYLKDAFENNTEDGNAPPAPSVTVEISGSFYDGVGPEVQSVTVDRTVVARGTTLGVSAHLTDRDGVETVWLRMFPDGGSACSCRVHEMDLASGTPEDGTWTASYAIASDIATGIYRFEVSADDPYDYYTRTDSEIGITVTE